MIGLDDLCVRFIINLPQEDLSSVARICFQVEEAQWFYEDFIRPLDPNLPSMSLRTFCLRIFQHCPLLASFSVENHTKAFEEFLQYKTRVPVRGAIMLNHAMDSVVLVKGWKKGANWSFPRGKINKDEDDLDCAVREVYEETGLDLRAAGLVPTEKKPKYIEISMREQQLRLYVFRDVPMDTKFQPRTRKEISKIQWYKLSELPAFRRKGQQNQSDGGSGPAVNKFYMVAPFLVPLKKWIHSQKKLNDKRATSGVHGYLPHHHIAVDEVVTTEDDTWAPGYSEQPSHVPAIETLDGATRELQRLLKMQPPTQGIQSPRQEDKGTALLSILQSGNAPPAPPTHQPAPLPHTPSNAIVSEPPHPQNPHHHTNLNVFPQVQSQPAPPSFPLAPDQGHASWNPAASLANNAQNAPSSYPDMPRHQQPGQQQLASAHTQPLPTQYQGPGTHDGLLQSQAASQHVPTMQSLSPSAASRQGLIAGQQNSQMPAGPSSAKLSGASLALLNAFKRDTGSASNSHLAQDALSFGHSAQPGAQGPPFFSQNARDIPMNQVGGVSTHGPGEQANVSELVGSSVQPREDPHRSALLGMFKKTPSNATTSQVESGSLHQQQLANPNQYAGVAGQAESMLLQHFQANRGPADHQLSLERLSIQTKPGQQSVPSPRRGENLSPYRYQQQQQAARSPIASGHSQQPQVPRILQRGQSLTDFGGSPPQQRGISQEPAPSALENATQRPLGSGAEPSVMANAGDRGRRPDGGREQKQQLLSLFGKQQSPGTIPPGSGVDSGESSEFPRSRVSSLASRGGETPISPAEQTFLLDYLQSVTKNTGRR